MHTNHLRFAPILLAFSALWPASVNADPCDSLSAQFVAWPSGLAVQFDILDPLSNAQYTWTFGDGASGLGSAPAHVYASSGSYQVCVIAAWLIPGGGPTDSCFADHCEWVTVSGGGGSPCDDLSAEFSWVATGLGVQFEISAPLLGAQYSWTFGDGADGSGVDPDHLYASSGSYQVCVIATWVIPGTSDTCVADHCEWVTVSGGGGSPCDDLSAEFTWVATGLGVQFEISAPLLGAQYSWTFGDGADGSGVDPDHIYASAGSYQACVIATWVIPGSSDTCVADHCEWITISGSGGSCDSLLEADYEWEDLGGNVVHFFDISYTAIGAPEYLWSLGDGTTGDAADPIHTFPASGSYWVCLTISAPIPGTGDSCSSTVCDTVVVGPGSITSLDALNGTLEVWPQPVTDMVTIDGRDLHGAVRLIILDTRGRTVASWATQAQAQLTIQLGPLPAGVYSLLASDAQCVRHARLVKE